ncbi:MAG: DUF3846 domain-containing protein [Clostridia bacterium]|nr:DUF3846 domain-containing protein [Clostridia bacterium]
MKIKCLLVMAGKEVQTMKIPASIKFIKSFIGENLYKVKLDDNTMLIANKEASLEEYNRIYKDSIILGTFLIVATKKKRIVSMKKRAIQKYFNMFKLRKHLKKVEKNKEEFLEEYYSNIRKIKQKNAERNKRIIFKIAA